MTKFIYNNTKNANTGHIPFKFNCGYYSRVFYKKDLDPRSKSKTAKKLSFELQNLMAICQQNLYHTQKIQKQAYNKRVKPQSYTSNNKIWLSSKHFRTKRNCKLETKFFGFFQILHLIAKQINKFELPKK